VVSFTPLPLYPEERAAGWVGSRADMDEAERSLHLPRMRFTGLNIVSIHNCGAYSHGSRTLGGKPGTCSPPTWISEIHNEAQRMKEISKISISKIQLLKERYQEYSRTISRNSLPNI
jgi:hypothetical protein